MRGNTRLSIKGDKIMPQKMEAELIFDHPDGRDLAVAALGELGFEVRDPRLG
jgi:hypothetical protein